MYLNYESILMTPYAEMLGENYSAETINTIRKDPISWLNSLPLTEYAHVMITVAWHQFGGSYEKYVTILYPYLISPILTRYYQDLEYYRMQRLAELRGYSSMQRVAPKEGHIIIRSNLAICTAHTKKLIRYLVEQFNYLKNEDMDSYRLRAWICFANSLAKTKDISEWGSVGERIQEIGENLTEEDLVNKLNEIIRTLNLFTGTNETLGSIVSALANR